MKEFIAITQDGKHGIYLSNDKQMELHLQDRENIYEIEDGELTLIATPESGFLVERPVFPVPVSVKIGDIK